MTPADWGIVSVASFLLLALLRVPVGVALALIGCTGIASLQGWWPAITQLQMISWDLSRNYVLITLPLFVLMGQLASATGLGRDLYQTFHVWFGRAPGGLAATAVISSAGFGAITGSSVASVVTIGQMLLPEMQRYRYDQALATGSLAASGVLAILIPPSIPMVFFGVWTETSIGDLFVAGVLPGLLLTVMFTGYVMIRCALRPTLGPAGPAFSLRAKATATLALLPTLSVFFLVILSIYRGVATPTEAAAVGVAAILILGLIRRTLTVASIKDSLKQSAAVSCDIFLLFIGGMLFGRYLSQTELITAWVNSIGQLQLAAPLLVALLVGLYLVLGAVLEGFSMIMLTLPFVVPLLTAAGYDPLWQGIFIVIMIELSLMTPPIGLNVMMLHRLTQSTSLAVIYRGTLPFAGLTLLLVVLIALFPEIVSWLPRHMKT